MADKYKEYECCALFRPDMEPEELDAEVEAITKLLEERGANVARVDRWNKRFLAYPIQDFTEGLYVVFRWFSDNELLHDLNYQLRFSDKVLRFLILDYTEKERKRRRRLGNRTAPGTTPEV